MREIKFRCWDKEGKCWLNENVAYEMLINQARWNPELSELYPLMQYTGLKDKNGKEIYEGDIVNVWGQSSNIASVGFLQGCFTLNWNDGSNTDLLGWYSFKRSVASDPKDFEIIGNIYDNPLPTNP